MPPWPNGIFSAQMIGQLLDEKSVHIERPLDDDQIQPASLDMRLGEKAFRVRSSFLPGPDNKVDDRIRELMLHEIDLKEGAVLERGCVYLVPLLESMNLPPDISASANPKSSTGRLDIFTRVICDYARQFDQVKKGYSGPLYLEVSPRTFPILARTGSRLTQVRFRKGDTRLNIEEHKKLHAEQVLVFNPNVEVGNGVSLSIDLLGEKRGGLVGFRSKHHTAVVDVDKKDALDVLDFWEPLHNRGRDELILDPDEFYILVSRESVHVPPDFAAEMMPFDHTVGEFRVHYAGFFDPGFGHDAAGGAGSRAVLEVRSHEVPFMLDHGQTIGRLIYERMAKRPKMLYGSDLGSNYQAQSLKLSKHFRPFSKTRAH